MSEPRLSVNVDHVATLRQARRAHFPDPVEAARHAEQAGAAGITVHLRGDRRHVQDHDVARLREAVHGKLNLEMSTAEEMVQIALRFKPDQVSLVPEQPGEVTTQGGLDVRSQGPRIAEVTRRLTEAGVAVSVFLDPDPAQIEALAALPAPRPHGFEINTDAYTSADDSMRAAELARVSAAAEHGRKLGFHVYAGHGLTTANVGPIAAIPGMEELNIGHSLVARAVLVGVGGAVTEMLTAMRQHL